MFQAEIRRIEKLLYRIAWSYLSYYFLDQNLVHQTSETVWQLIPVWQIRGYDTILDQRLEGVLSTYSEEDRIKYDPEKPKCGN